MNPHKEVEISDRVRKFLDSPEWQSAFDGYRLELIALIEKTDSDQVVMRAKAHLEALAKVKAGLETMVKNGVVASEVIRLESRKKWWQVK